MAFLSTMLTPHRASLCFATRESSHNSDDDDDDDGQFFGILNEVPDANGTPISHY